jgi:acyl-CoA synthetase (NDP forming)
VSRRDLTSLFAPRSVAVVGASADPAKWGHALARGALRGAHRRSVYLVNRSGGEILGTPSYSSLADLPDAPELVVVCVPAATFETAVGDALSAGAQALVGISAGLGETGEEGRAREQTVVERVRAAGAVLLGPNCLGVADTGADLDLGWTPLPAGGIGLISQSGNLGLEIARLAGSAGLGFSRFASLGNQADLDAADLLEDFANHEATSVIALYVEDFRDGRAFVEAAASAGKPVVLLAGGVTQAGAQAARSHTGALVSDDRAIDAACRAAGIVRVATPRQLVDAAQVLLTGRVPAGRRIAVYGDGGGHGIVAVDVLAAHGLEVPILSDDLQRALGDVLPDSAVLVNPVDLAGAGEQRLASYADAGRLLLGSGDVDAVLLTGYFGGYGVDTPTREPEEVRAAQELVAAASASGVSLVVHTIYPDAPATRTLISGGVPVYPHVEAAAAALAALASFAERRPRPARLDEPTPPVPRPEPGYFGARAFVAAAGIAVSEARLVGTVEDAIAAAADVGYPVALKRIDALHKSDTGGVALDLDSPDELIAACRRLGPGELSLERMERAATGVELIVGVTRDPRFGPVALAGFGGIYAEVLRDVAVALAPLDEDEALQLLGGLRGAAILVGARGRARVDVAEAARVLAALSRAAAACPDIREVEVNPLLVDERGAVALDARVVLS